MASHALSAMWQRSTLWCAKHVPRQARTREDLPCSPRTPAERRRREPAQQVDPNSAIKARASILAQPQFFVPVEHEHDNSLRELHFQV
jgi:hypothetical protein